MLVTPSNVEFVGVLLLTLCLFCATSVLSVLLCVKVVVKYCQNVIYSLFSLFYVVACPRDDLNATCAEVFGGGGPSPNANVFMAVKTFALLCKTMYICDK